MKTIIPLIAFLLLASVASSAGPSLYVFPWNNYGFRSLGVPALMGVGPDVSGVQLLIVGDDLSAGTLYLFKVEYAVNGRMISTECSGRVAGNSAGCYLTLGRHAEDYRVTKVTATPYAVSGPDTAIDLAQ